MQLSIFSKEPASKRKERLIRGDGENRRERKSLPEGSYSIEERETFPKQVYKLRKRRYIAIAVTIAERSHLFSYRTQKLSSLTPKVLEDYPPGG